MFDRPMVKDRLSLSCAAALAGTFFYTPIIACTWHCAIYYLQPELS